MSGIVGPEPCEVPSPTRGDSPTGTDESFLSLLLMHQRSAWQRGEPAEVEVYLAQQPALQGDPAAVLDLIYNEIVLREEAGELPQLDEYLRRFPKFAPELRLQFEVEEAMRLGRLDSTEDDPTLAVDSRANRPSPARPDIPGYEVLEELGRGGMGVVYRARQLRLNRIVALKTILAGDHATPEAAVRFLAEAEAVARLQHPNIVQIFAFGEHEGRSYFEMEYVPGGNLAGRTGGESWSPRDAARLVETLARAIHEVHRLGIVHRDLKPANILLSAEDEPKIADFGLAKWLNVETGLTRSQWIIGSPHYMAPEQAGGLGAVGPAADVYSLGAILYELLTGRPPFRAATVLETLEQVKTAMPVIPTRLRPTLPRDVVTICLKCLEKDPARRYAGADILAEDLRRFGAGEPILARPPSGPEKLWRLCRREPALALLALSLIAGLVGASTQWWRAERHLRDANEHRRSAEASYRKQLKAYEDLGRAKGRAQVRLDAAMKAVRRFQEMSIAPALLRDPGLESLRARLLRTLLDFYRDLQASLEDDASPDAHGQLSDAYADAAKVTYELGLPEEALTAYQHSLRLVEQIAAASPGDPSVMTLLGRSHTRIGYVLRITGRPAAALEAYERARAIQEPLARDYPEVTRYREMLSWTYSNLGVINLELGHAAEAIRFHRRAISIHEAMVALDPENHHLRHDLAWGWRYLCQAEAASGNFEDASRLADWAVEGFEELIKDNATDPETRWRLARCLDEVGRLRVLTGRADEAAAPLDRAAGLFAALYRDNPVYYGGDVVRNHLYRATQNVFSDRPEKAKACISQAGEILSRPSKTPRELVLFDMACSYGLWSVSGTDGSIAADEREPRARRSIAALRRAAESGRIGLDRLRRDPVLAPFRDRADFRELLLDLAFPAVPFAGKAAEER